MPRGLGNLSSPTGMEPGPPAVEVWSPNHWTVRNSQTIYLKWVNIMVCAKTLDFKEYLLTQEHAQYICYTKKAGHKTVYEDTSSIT